MWLHVTAQHARLIRKHSTDVVFDVAAHDTSDVIPNNER